MQIEDGYPETFPQSGPFQMEWPVVFVDDDDDNNNNNNTKLLITVTLNKKLQGHITQLINIKKHLKQMLHDSRSQLR